MEALDSALSNLKSLHDHPTDFVMPPGHANHQIAGTHTDVVCHWDATPYNFVFDGTRAVGFIDFDEAEPGRRIDDLACFAYRYAPLSNDGGWPDDIDRYIRLSTFSRRTPTQGQHSCRI
ncbi:Ser/Thr protein kinase RdoA (MazF antagonist) [Rhodococcus sp. 27YEA15]|uniref:phosphotransferase n=1 Tax=Rhodococcus sp. 27YEA15 TaxID=3156259 RepID=UPI003C7BF9D0